MTDLPPPPSEPEKPPYDGSTYPPPQWRDVPPPPPMTGQSQGYYNGPNYPGPVYNGSNNALALASMILGIAGLVFMCIYGFGGVFSVAALITGYMARKQTLSPSDHGKVKAGIITGWVGVAISALIIISVVILIIVGVSMDPGNMTGTGH